MFTTKNKHIFEENWGYFAIGLFFLLGIYFIALSIMYNVKAKSKSIYQELE